MIRAAHESGRIGMESTYAEALASFRQFNYERVYLRDASKKQASQVITLLRALVEHYFNHPYAMPEGARFDATSNEAHHAAVAYVAGMTDRFACRQAVSLLGWSPDQLPTGVDVANI
jgi:dGTPase